MISAYPFILDFSFSGRRQLRVWARQTNAAETTFSFRLNAG